MSVVGLALELFFDDATERAIRLIRDAITRSGARPLLDEMCDRPHVSLAVMSAGDETRLVDLAAQLGQKLESFPLLFSAVGVFAGSGGILYLSPTPTQALLDAHVAAHRLLRGSDFCPHAYYLAGRWTPHCTVAQELAAEQMPLALDAARRALQPISGRFAAVGVVRFRPVTPLGTFPLRS